METEVFKAKMDITVNDSNLMFDDKYHYTTPLTSRFVFCFV